MPGDGRHTFTVQDNLRANTHARDTLPRMTIELAIPPALIETLRQRLPSLDRAALEGLALEGYRHGALSLAQVRELLGFASRWEAQEFLASFGSWPDYDPETLAAELSPLEA